VQRPLSNLSLPADEFREQLFLFGAQRETLQQVRAPVGTLPAPAQVRLVNGKTSGSAIARCRRIVQASAYQWRIAPAATPTAWLPVVTTFAANAEFQGLASTTVYVVQVCAVGTAGVGNWSGTATVLVV